MLDDVVIGAVVVVVVDGVVVLVGVGATAAVAIGAAVGGDDDIDADSGLNCDAIKLPLASCAAPTMMSAGRDKPSHARRRLAFITGRGKKAASSIVGDATNAAATGGGSSKRKSDMLI